MMSLYEKSLKILELDSILDMLSGEAVTDAAKELIRQIRPQKNIDEVQRLQNETSAACFLISLKGSPSFYGIKDIRATLQRASMGGTLNTRELLNIASVLKSASSAKKYSINDSNTKTCIDYMFSELQGNQHLEKRISESIISEEEISDRASSELADIRRKIRFTNLRVRENIQKIITSSKYSKALQEQIITMRSGRYVVPVKSEHKNEIPGLVHDISSSGATLFIEPMQVVTANNELKELEAKEEKEIERILAELSAETSEHADNIIRDYELLISLDLIFARGRLSFKMKASAPDISIDGTIILRHARHPLLDPKKVVPIDVELGNSFDTLMITGPNTGGKTVALKTIGLLTAMAQCGMHIPADDGCNIRIFDKILADIGDEQSIEQSLSTFSAHMSNIISILNEADNKTLILVDELGAGTDPVEGAALAIAIIEYARNLNSLIVATTHYAELKIYAMTTDGVENACCEFDIETLKPTYRLLIGIPGKSNAFAISQKLGLPEEIVTRARQQIDKGAADFESVIEELNKKHQEIEQLQKDTEIKLRAASEEKKKADAYRQKMEHLREKAEEIAKEEARELVKEARAAATEVFEQLKTIKTQSNLDFQQENAMKSELLRKLNEAEKMTEIKKEEPVLSQTRSAVAGDVVEILKTHTRANVISVNDNGTLNLQAGILKITVKQQEVKVIEGGKVSEVKKHIEKVERELKTLTQSPEIDLRGMTSDDAINAADQFIDNAYMARLNTVTIIHGKGTGALRSAVHQSLKKNSHVRSFRLGRYGEGEAGVTVVELKR